MSSRSLGVGVNDIPSQFCLSRRMVYEASMSAANFSSPAGRNSASAEEWFSSSTNGWSMTAVPASRNSTLAEEGIRRMAERGDVHPKTVSQFCFNRKILALQSARQRRPDLVELGERQRA